MCRCALKRIAEVPSFLGISTPFHFLRFSETLNTKKCVNYSGSIKFLSVRVKVQFQSAISKLPHDVGSSYKFRLINNLNLVPHIPSKYWHVTRWRPLLQALTADNNIAKA